MIRKEIVRAGDESNIEDDYDNERHVLSSLRCLKHPSIVRLVTAYSKGDTYNFLFPVADGDLKKLLSLEQRPSLLGSDQAIFDALWSLSSAVESIHSYFSRDFNVRQIGCHYDIKPGNILYQGERFLLSDFGLSRLRDDSEGSRSLYKGVEGSYIAPECEPASEGFERAKIGRSSDVWSFGCFLSEILAYLNGGPDDVKKFHTGRRAKQGPHWGHYFHVGNRLNPAVIEFLQSFDVRRPENEDLHSLSGIVKAALQIEPEKRFNASVMTLRIFHLAQKNRFQTICSLLDDRPYLKEFELEMEYLRLKIWAETVGIASEWDEMPDTAWLSTPRNHEELEKIQEGLKKCHGEVESVKDDVKTNKPFTYNRYYHLQRTQDDLWDMQHASIRKSMMSRLEDMVLNMNDETLLPDSRARLNEQAALPYELESSLGANGVPRAAYRRIILLSMLKRIASALAHQKHADQDLVLDKNSLSKPSIPYHCHSLSRLVGVDRKVLTERMVYQESWYPRVEELLQRVKAITSFRNNIPDVIPILKSRGYYHDPSQHHFGIVYELPSFAQDTHPMSLHDIIHQTESRLHQPSLTMKFDLAIKLVDCVLSFHKAGWLHKNICSFNLMCFPDVFPTKAASITHPWMIGFNYSRLNHKTAFTEGPGYELALQEYQHPEYLKVSSRDYSEKEHHAIRYRQEFDYYSVGLVLLEVGLWKSLSRITKNIRGSPEELLKRLLKDYIPVVKTHMGDFYGEAVTACLTSYSGANEEPNEARKDFESRVVNPIRERSV